MYRFATRCHGFTLVELTVVLIIVSLVFGGMTLSLSATSDIAHSRQTQHQLTEIKNALLGFAAATGRLPCPATDTSNGQESFCLNDTGECGGPLFAPASASAHGRCSNPFNGFLPAVTLGLPEQDGNGFVRDSWGSASNRFRYAVADTTINQTSHPFTRANGMKSATLKEMASATLLTVCSSAVDIHNGGCPSTGVMSTSAIAVIASLGRNASSGGFGVDEAENLNGDTFFISHPRRAADSPGGEFDDQLTWIAPSVLFNRMIAAGKLP